MWGKTLLQPTLSRHTLLKQTLLRQTLLRQTPLHPYSHRPAHTCQDLHKPAHTRADPHRPSQTSTDPFRPVKPRQDLPRPPGTPRSIQTCLDPPRIAQSHQDLIRQTLLLQNTGWPKKNYTSFVGLRGNMGVSKIVRSTYFWITNEKFDSSGPILSKISLSEKWYL